MEIHILGPEIDKNYR